MAVIAEVGNPTYYMDRAIEAMHQAKSCIDPTEANNHLRQAVGLILLTTVCRPDGQNSSQ